MPGASSSPRFTSLDTLRGLAILLMIFSGLLPKTLPNWMDHGYQPHFKPSATGQWLSALDPSGDAVFNARWKAFTWVDLVFPMFLFSMGAAIPLAMARRLERGDSKLTLARTIFARWLMLIFFAVLLYHISPPASDTFSDDARRLLLLAAFPVAFLFFVRWPADMPPAPQRAIRWLAGCTLVGLAAAYAVQGAFLANAKPGHEGLRFAWQSDTIIMVLAHSYLIAALTWLVLPRWPWLRLAVLLPVMLFAHYLQFNAKNADHHYLYPDWQWMGDWPMTRTLFTIHNQPWTLLDIVQSPKLLLNLPHLIPPLANAAASRPWIAQLTDLSVLWDFTWYKFLWIVIPGTVVGDAFLQRSRDTSSFEVSIHRRWLPLALALLTITLTCIGLRHYGYKTLNLGGPFRTPYFALVTTLPVLAASIFIALKHLSPTRRLTVAGALLAACGLALASTHFEGGISKGPPATLSYYLLTTGLCTQLLAGLSHLFDARPPRPVTLLAANGQNPLLAYFIDHTTLAAILSLSIVPAFHTISPWFAAALAALKTLLIAAFVLLLTRKKILWRA